MKPSKLSRSYSVSAIMPTAADPNHLMAHAASGKLDVEMVTLRNGTNIEVRKIRCPAEMFARAFMHNLAVGRARRSFPADRGVPICYHN